MVLMGLVWSGSEKNPELPKPLQFARDGFEESVKDQNIILNTLRLNDCNGEIVGFAKGGPLENYEMLHQKIKDENPDKINQINNHINQENSEKENLIEKSKENKYGINNNLNNQNNESQNPTISSQSQPTRENDEEVWDIPAFLRQKN